jgi:peptidoglycan/xylan/chitin deacetylase (PgdA/CDA1 family)
MALDQTLRRGAARVLAPVARAITGRRARVLMYHRFGEPGSDRRIDMESFEQHVRYIRRNFRPRRLEDLVTRLREGQPLEERTVVITVDDGYQDFAEYAYPILERYEVPATVYVVSEFASQRLWLWFDALDFLTHEAAVGRYELAVGDRTVSAELASPADRRALWLSLADYCIRLSAPERMVAIGEFQRQLGVSLPSRPTTEYAAMSWDQVRRLDAGLVEIGAHTRTHPILSQCPVEQQRTEVADCKRAIEAQLGREVRAFCYPNGMPEDFTSTTVDIVRESGFTNAVMACGGILGNRPDLYRLERVGAPIDLRLFRNCIDGLWELRDRGQTQQRIAY